MLGAAGMPTGRASLLRLAGFLEPAGHGRFRFRHALIRAAAYEGLSFRRRRELHNRVGELLETGPAADDQAELLSLHFFHAGRSDKAWHYSRVAGDRSLARYAYVEAAEFYTRAVDSARRLPELDGAVVSRALESLGDVQMQVGDSDDARRSYRAARARLRVLARGDRAPAAAGGEGRPAPGPHPAVPARADPRLSHAGPRAGRRRRRPACRADRAQPARVLLRVVPVPAGPLPRGGHLGEDRRAARGRGRRHRRAGRDLRGPATGVDVVGARRRPPVRPARPGALRVAGRPRAAGEHAQQPRRRGVLRRAVDRRARHVRPRDRRLRGGRQPAGSPHRRSTTRPRSCPVSGTSGRRRRTC